MLERYFMSLGRHVRVTLLVAGCVIFAPVVLADEPGSPTEIFTIARGGELYDNWWAVLEQDAPRTTHPAYPAAGKKSGGTTWRCKECHGWDYKGVDGAYGSGSHYTGIKGITAYRNADVARIKAIIRDDTHRYTKALLPDNAVEKLALFVSRGQIDMDKYIDRKTKRARGDIGRGASLYQTVCAVCHGFDGKAINFKDENKPEFIGTVANENPWEVLHKIRNGQPGVSMVAMAALSVEDQVAILAYAQTLPRK